MPWMHRYTAWAEAATAVEVVRQVEVATHAVLMCCSAHRDTFDFPGDAWEAMFEGG